MNFGHISFDILIEILEWVAQPKTPEHSPGMLAQSRGSMVLWPPRRHKSKEITATTRDIYHCALVCRDWRWPALYVLYHDIGIKMHKPGGYNLVRNLRMNQHLGNYVRVAGLLSDTLHAKALLYLGLYCPHVKELQINHLRPFHKLDYQALQNRSPFRLLTTLVCVTASDPAVTLRTLALTLLLMPSLKILGFSNLPPIANIFDLPMPSFRIKAFYAPTIESTYIYFCRWLLSGSIKTLNTVAVDPIAFSILGLEQMLHDAAPYLHYLQLPCSLLPSVIELLTGKDKAHARMMDLHELSLIHGEQFQSHLLHDIQSPLEKLTILPHPFCYRSDFDAVQICRDLASDCGEAPFLKGLKTIRVQIYQGIPSHNQLNYMENWCMARQIKFEVFEDWDE